ncbi:hypothetical protein NIES806_17100 [Dolichospermum compactum NIES-806]|uniref:Uncharacterized protein n=1 Tax=Dolichospermum compactum NIES-806 TaxID=1973481 RepID=A0A1Z4V204_9CYAN|nr:hypothetical protein NIES806_17100 [Dolichospermum compactum NIES-806]
MLAANDTTAIEEPSNREPFQHLLIGLRKAVISTIHNLQVFGYTDFGDWF